MTSSVSASLGSLHLSKLEEPSRIRFSPFFDTVPSSSTQQIRFFPLTELFPKERSLITFLLLFNVSPDLLLAVSGQLPPEERAAAFKALIQLSQEFLAKTKEGQNSEQRILLTQTLEGLSLTQSLEAPHEEHREAKQILYTHFYEAFSKEIPNLSENPNFVGVIARFYGDETSNILRILLIKNSPRSDEKVRTAAYSVFPSYPKQSEPNDPALNEEINQWKDQIQLQITAPGCSDPHMLLFRILVGTLSFNERIVFNRAFYPFFVQCIQEDAFWAEDLQERYYSLYEQASHAIEERVPLLGELPSSLTVEDFTQIFTLIERGTEERNKTSLFSWLLQNNLPQSSPSPNPFSEGAETTHIMHSSTNQHLKDLQPQQLLDISPATPDKRAEENVFFDIPSLPMDTIPFSSPHKPCLPKGTKRNVRDEDFTLMTLLSSGNSDCEFLSLLSKSTESSSASTTPPNIPESGHQDLPLETKLIPFLLFHQDLDPLILSSLLGTLDPIHKKAIALAVSLLILTVPSDPSSTNLELDALKELVTQWIETNPLLTPLSISSQEPIQQTQTNPFLSPLLAQEKSMTWEPDTVSIPPDDSQEKRDPLTPLREAVQNSHLENKKLSAFFYTQFAESLFESVGLFAHIKTFYSHYDPMSSDPLISTLRQLFLRNIC